MIIVGLPFRTRFGGDFAIGRTIPYILQNAPCEVCVVREPMPEETSVKSSRSSAVAASARPSPSAFARAGHEVTVIDPSTPSLRPASLDFPGNALRGDGTDEDVLRRAGAENADSSLALTEGDNRNVLAAQLAAEALGVERVVAKINDPVRAEAYADLGIATICRTRHAGRRRRRVRSACRVGSAGILAPTGSHPGAGRPSRTESGGEAPSTGRAIGTAEA